MDGAELCSTAAGEGSALGLGERPTSPCLPIFVFYFIFFLFRGCDLSFLFYLNYNSIAFIWDGGEFYFPQIHREGYYLVCERNYLLLPLLRKNINSFPSHFSFEAYYVEEIVPYCILQVAVIFSLLFLFFEYRKRELPFLICALLDQLLYYYHISSDFL